MVETVKTPLNFLQFLTAASRWVMNYEWEHKTGSRTDMFVYLLTDTFAITWFEGGRDIIGKLAKQVEENYSQDGAEGFNNHIGTLLKAFGWVIAEEGIFDNQDMDNYLNGITALTKIGCSMQDYEYDRKTKIIENEMQK